MYSNTKLLESSLNWLGVHIEAAPSSYARLARNRPRQLNAHVAVCEQPQAVHYVEGPRAAANGILEFMSPAFLSTWHRAVNVSALPVVSCLPLSTVLSALAVSHVNLFVLDVEGAELKVLRSIDFSRLSFDVIVVEADGSSAEKDHAVIQWLTDRGYRYDGHVLRNDWFAREGFVPAAAPDPLAAGVQLSAFVLPMIVPPFMNNRNVMQRFQAVSQPQPPPRCPTRHCACSSIPSLCVFIHPVAVCGHPSRHCACSSIPLLCVVIHPVAVCGHPSCHCW